MKKFFVISFVTLFCSTSLLVAMEKKSLGEQLYWAVLRDEKDHVKNLLELGVSTQWMGSRGMTSLHVAADFSRWEIAQMLLRAGAKVNMQACNGTTPLHLAAKWGVSVIAKMLIEYGADPRILNKKGKNCLQVTVDNIRPYLLTTVRYLNDISINKFSNKKNIDLVFKEFCNLKIPVDLARIAVSWEHKEILTYLAKERYISPNPPCFLYLKLSNFADLMAQCIHQKKDKMLDFVIDIAGNALELSVKDLMERYPKKIQDIVINAVRSKKFKIKPDFMDVIFEFQRSINNKRGGALNCKIHNISPKKF